MSNNSFSHQLSPGHRACAGCGLAIAARHVADAAGKNTIIANATGCLEVFSTPYPQSAWKMPWVHSLFENAPAIASGIYASLKKRRLMDIATIEESGKLKKINVIAQGGDGATFDIGFGLISGMWERGENILYVCYDNEAYMNTGIQASGATPYGASTTTAPSGDLAEGNDLHKKDMVAIALAHKLKYVATSTCAYPLDIQNKVKKALQTEGPSYLQILTACVPGWKAESDMTIQIGKLAHQTGLYPVIEFVDGKLSKVMAYPNPRLKVEEYLKLQGRFKHLFRDEKGKVILGEIQEMAEENILKYKID